MSIYFSTELFGANHFFFVMKLLGSEEFTKNIEAHWELVVVYYYIFFLLKSLMGFRRLTKNIEAHWASITTLYYKPTSVGFGL